MASCQRSFDNFSAENITSSAKRKNRPAKATESLAAGTKDKTKTNLGLLVPRCQALWSHSH